MVCVLGFRCNKTATREARAGCWTGSHSSNQRRDRPPSGWSWSGHPPVESARFPWLDDPAGSSCWAALTSPVRRGYFGQVIYRLIKRVSQRRFYFYGASPGGVRVVPMAHRGVSTALGRVYVHRVPRGRPVDDDQPGHFIRIRVATVPMGKLLVLVECKGCQGCISPRWTDPVGLPRAEPLCEHSPKTRG